MGQRLVIQITENGDPLANAYYHWSAYTETAAEMTNDVIGYLDVADKKFTPKQKAVWALMQTGARFAPDELAFMKEENINKDEYSFAFDDKEADRNSGLLCVSEKGIDQNVFWEEGRTEIDVADGTIYFGVMGVETTESMKEYYNDFDVDSQPILDGVPDDLEFYADGWDKFYTKLKRLTKTGYCAVSPDKEIVYSFIC